MGELNDKTEEDPIDASDELQEFARNNNSNNGATSSTITSLTRGVFANAPGVVTFGDSPGDSNHQNAAPTTGGGGVEVIDAPVNFTATDEPFIARFKDHFTLQIPSSMVRYRESHSAARVIELPDAQFVLEETFHHNQHNLSIRRIHDTSEGVRSLRMLYALVTAFWTGFLFVFCLQVLLFLVLDLAIDVGATSKSEADWKAAIGVIFAFPAFVYGLSSALVIAGAYIMDTWRGHYLIRNFTFRSLKQVSVEWTFFFVFLGGPIFIMCLTLLARTDRWWEITALVWFCCILAFYVLFAANVIWYEWRACWEVSRNRYKGDKTGFWHNVKRAILLRQISRYSGRVNYSYLSFGSIKSSEYTDKSTRKNLIEGTDREDKSYFAKFTSWKLLVRLGLYKHLEEKERIYTIEDVRDIRPYVTAYTWNLEKVFCRPNNSRYIAIVGGPGAVTRAQMRSSAICSILGTLMILFVVLSALVYLEAGLVATFVLVIGGAFIAYSRLKSTFRLFRATKQLILARTKFKEDAENATTNSEDEGYLENESECVYLVYESYRFTKATKRFCWIMFGSEILFFFLWPLCSLLAVSNYPLAILFFFLAGISGIRYYISAAVVLEETGHLDLVDGTTDRELWRNQSRLNEIVGNITRGRSRGAWVAVLGSVGLVFVALMLGALGTDLNNEVTFDTTYTYTNDYYYPQQDSLRYPTCKLTSDLGTSPLTNMADYAFLAGLAYRGVNVTQEELNSWFGDGNAIDQQDVVDAWLANRTESAVSFKLVTYSNFSYILIRGTQNPWDMLTDAQLWSAAALMQVHRALLPIGNIWTPIIDQLIRAISFLESSSIDRVSFYKDTTAFAEYIKTLVPSVYTGVAITGHSLGGGLSIISGSQTGLPAVALSGPNAMLSRRSFDPPITKEDLDSKTFNIIPHRDVVPMIDDRAQNFQEIRCQTAQADVVGCHDSTRSLCEIIYTCGTRGRPVFCECWNTYGYPPAIANDGVTVSFTDFCEGLGRR